MQFNHVANRLDPRHFETVVAMLKEKLRFVELRRTERSIWLRQPGANVDLQFSRSDTSNRDAAFGLTQPARNYRDLMPIDRPRYVRFCGEMLKRRVRACAGARCLVPLRNA